jgi:hypothetical protein
MEYIVGASLALAVGVFGTLSRLDRDRAFYPTVLVVIATYYNLFAVISGSPLILGAEAVGTLVCVAVAVIGFRTSLWLVVAALAGHGAFDLVHARLIADPGVPAWWPGFCSTYDIVAALYLAWTLLRRGAEAFASRIHPHVDAEMQAAANFETAGEPAMAFHHLERAHVLAQSSTFEHARVHLAMLVWSLRHRDQRETQGQLIRILGAATKTPLGLVPIGNTGGADISPFQRLPIPQPLASLIQAASRPSIAAVFVAILLVGAGVSGSGRAASPQDLRIADAGGQSIAYRVQGPASR